MDILRTYLNSLSIHEQNEYCQRCATTRGYLRKAISNGEKLRLPLCIQIEYESQGKVFCEELRKDVVWVRTPDAFWPHPDGRPLIDIYNSNTLENIKLTNPSP